MTPDSIATCRTEGCANAGIGIEFRARWTDENGDHNLTTVFCGECGNRITDIQDIEES